MNKIPQVIVNSEPLARDCHGFRKTPDRCSRAELRAMHAAENSVLRFARIQNGVHPDYQNGHGPGFSKRECRRAYRFDPRPSASAAGAVRLV